MTIFTLGFIIGFGAGGLIIGGVVLYAMMTQ